LGHTSNLHAKTAMDAMPIEILGEVLHGDPAKKGNSCETCVS
jgi:hypothetical protein